MRYEWLLLLPPGFLPLALLLRRLTGSVKFNPERLINKDQEVYLLEEGEGHASVNSWGNSSFFLTLYFTLEYRCLAGLC